MNDNKLNKIIAACGNDCAVCPRYIKEPYSKTAKQLAHTAELWHKIGYRERVVTNDEISCMGCTEDNWCRYQVVKCTNEKKIDNCGSCKEYPCANIKDCFAVTKSFEPFCRKVCTDDEYQMMKKAFFEKEENLNNSIKIKNIVFDIGMVLIDFHWAKTMRELGFSEEVVATLGKNMMQHPTWNEMDRNVMAEEDIVKEFKKLSPMYEAEIDLFLRNLDKVVTVFPKSDEWLRNLKERGYQVYLLSNYPERTFKVDSKKYTFMDYVDGKVVSYECHYTKPEKEIYDLLCDRYKLRPEECVFLDDKYENIEAAKSYGFEGIQVQNQEQAIAELDELLAKKGAYENGK